MSNPKANHMDYLIGITDSIEANIKVKSILDGYDLL